VQAEKIMLTAEKETLLITLYCRAMENRKENPILKDAFAGDILQHIDYDFSKLAVRKADQFSAVVRAKQLDVWTEGFLADHPGATVLHLACGLDSRVFRVNPSSNVRWLDVDYPEVIALRERLYPKLDGDYQMIGSSVNEMDWLEHIPADRPTLILAEGLTMYLSEQQVRELFERLIDHFPGGELMFDAYTLFGTRMARKHHSIKATGAAILWGIDNPRDIEQWNSRLKFIRQWSFLEAPAINTLSAIERLLYKGMANIPAMKYVHRLLHFRF
jgi:O-methyltransferase involved in polyketide biosynthesis